MTRDGFNVWTMYCIVNTSIFPPINTPVLHAVWVYEYRHTLGLFPINRILQRSIVAVIFETSIDLDITSSLRSWDTMAGWLWPTGTLPEDFEIMMISHSICLVAFIWIFLDQHNIERALSTNSGCCEDLPCAYRGYSIRFLIFTQIYEWILSNRHVSWIQHRHTHRQYIGQRSTVGTAPM